MTRRQINTPRAQKRIRVIKGDVQQLDEILSKREIDGITGVHGSSLLNEFFRCGSRQVVDYLKYLKSVFPERPAVFVDYYGRLGSTKRDAADCGHTLLQDLVHVLNGQGVPLTDWKDRRKLYESARERLIHRSKSKANGMAFLARATICLPTRASS